MSPIDGVSDIRRMVRLGKIRLGIKVQPVEEGKNPYDVTEDDVPDINAVFRVCWQLWQMQPVEVCGQLGFKTVMDAVSVGVKPWEAFLTIKGFKQPKKD